MTPKPKPDERMIKGKKYQRLCGYLDDKEAAEAHAKRIRDGKDDRTAVAAYDGKMWVVYDRKKSKRSPPARGKKKRQEDEMLKTFFD